MCGFLQEVDGWSIVTQTVLELMLNDIANDCLSPRPSSLHSHWQRMKTWKLTQKPLEGGKGLALERTLAIDSWQSAAKHYWSFEPSSSFCARRSWKHVAACDCRVLRMDKARHFELRVLEKMKALLVKVEYWVLVWISQRFCNWAGGG